MFLKGLRFFGRSRIIFGGVLEVLEFKCLGPHPGENYRPQSETDDGGRAILPNYTQAFVSRRACIIGTTL